MRNIKLNFCENIQKLKDWNESKLKKYGNRDARFCYKNATCGIRDFEKNLCEDYHEFLNDNFNYSLNIEVENYSDNDLKNVYQYFIQEFLLQMKDVAQHGVNCGFNGFIYCNEIRAFFNKHKSIILELLKKYGFFENLANSKTSEVAVMLESSMDREYPNPYYNQKPSEDNREWIEDSIKRLYESMSDEDKNELSNLSKNANAGYSKEVLKDYLAKINKPLLSELNTHNQKWVFEYFMGLVTSYDVYSSFTLENKIEALKGAIANNPRFEVKFYESNTGGLKTFIEYKVFCDDIVIYQDYNLQDEENLDEDLKLIKSIVCLNDTLLNSFIKELKELECQVNKRKAKEERVCIAYDTVIKLFIEKHLINDTKNMQISKESMEHNCNSIEWMCDYERKYQFAKTSDNRYRIIFDLRKDLNKQFIKYEVSKEIYDFLYSYIGVDTYAWGVELLPNMNGLWDKVNVFGYPIAFSHNEISWYGKKFESGAEVYEYIKKHYNYLQRSFIKENAKKLEKRYNINFDIDF